MTSCANGMMKICAQECVRSRECPTSMQSINDDGGENIPGRWRLAENGLKVKLP